MNNTNWTIEQTVELFELAARSKTDGDSLAVAFKTMAEKTGRSVNSVRNYYYGQAKTFELVPEVAAQLGIRTAAVERERFIPFTAEEVRALVEYVLRAGGMGKSVRRALHELSGGDAKAALRYQNKYRSVLKSHRDLVEEVAADLAARGIAYRDPYKKAESDNFARLTEYLAELDSKRVGKFLSLIEKLT